VLGVHTRQLNKDFSYAGSATSVNELVAWSGWGLLDTRFDETAALLAPRLVAMADESASLEDRVRSYWDGNCAMCHAGTAGSVKGWDARYATPFDQAGLGQAPSQARADVTATRLIEPGYPERSLIYLRGDSEQDGLKMPPLGRYRIDDHYVDVLGRWIASLSQD
jgi:hypothetical protein